MSARLDPIKQHVIDPVPNAIAIHRSKLRELSLYVLKFMESRAPGVAVPEVPEQTVDGFTLRALGPPGSDPRRPLLFASLEILSIPWGRPKRARTMVGETTGIELSLVSAQARLMFALRVCFVITGCTVDDRSVAVTAGAGGATSETVNQPTASSGTANLDVAGGASLPAPSESPGASPNMEAAADPCESLPLSRCECAVGETTTCLAEYASRGVCGERLLNCEMPGVWPTGSACLPASEELCTPGLLDEDCDGDVDEGCECIDGEFEGCGAENSGVRACAAGAWGACICEGEQSLDLDRNGIADATETLVENGAFSIDLSGWDIPSDDGVGTYNQFAEDDADELACSGSMQLMTLDSSNTVGTGVFTWVTNYAQECLSSTVGSVAAFARARLLMNTGDYNGSLEATGVDPSLVSLSLWAYGLSDCGGEALAEQVTPIELPTDGSWKLLDGTLVAGDLVQSWRIRLSVLGDDVDGAQSTGVRLVHFDSVLLRPLE